MKQTVKSSTEKNYDKIRREGIFETTIRKNTPTEVKAKFKKTHVIEDVVEEIIKEIKPKIVKEIKQESQSMITGFLKPISKSQFEKKIKTENKTEPSKKNY